MSLPFTHVDLGTGLSHYFLYVWIVNEDLLLQFTQMAWDFLLLWWTLWVWYVL